MRSAGGRTSATYWGPSWANEVRSQVRGHGALLLGAVGVLALLVVGGLPLGGPSTDATPGGSALRPSMLDEPASAPGASPGTFPIYQFALSGRTVSEAVDIGTAGVYISSVTVSSSPGTFQLTWGPVNIGLARGVTTNTSFTIVVQAYIPTNVTTVQLIFGVTGWTNVSVVQENGVLHHVVGGTGLAGPGEILTPAADLELEGPLSTVVDTLHGAVAHQIYAYYYAWYDPPSSWQGGVNGTYTSSVAGTPELGFYSSHNVAVIKTQIQEAQATGIDAFLESWIPTQSFINESLGIVYPEAAHLGFKIGLQYETNETLVQAGLTQAQALSAFVGQIEWYLSNFTSSPAMLRIGGVPLIFIWQANSYPASFWQKAFNEIRTEHNAYFIAEASGNYSDFQVFDGVDIYGVNFPMVLDGLATNFTDGNFTGDTAVSYWGMQWEAALHNRLWFAPAEPGFNDLNDPSEPPKYTPRLNGSVYKATWDLAAGSGADGVTITSWNEWHEGTNIEPAASAPVPWASSDQYLNLTQCEIDRFLEANLTIADTCSGVGGGPQANSTQPIPPNVPPGGGAASAYSPWPLVAGAAALGAVLTVTSVLLSTRVQREAPRGRSSTRAPRTPPPKR
jgi:glycoprotein endo-alpha-1,2-mannosidase